VDDVELVVIPTMSKAKISRDLSYPIGAEGISRALDGVPQLPLLRLQFYFWSDHSLRRGNYEFLRVEYLNNSTPLDEYPVSDLYKRSPQYRWEIVVQPVPRVHRHRIKTHIIESALSEISEWLVQRADYAQNGSEVLAFFYDEKLDEFKAYRVAHLEPVR
jgi:hypothetical protein